MCEETFIEEVFSPGASSGRRVPEKWEEKENTLKSISEN